MDLFASACSLFMDHMYSFVRRTSKQKASVSQNSRVVFSPTLSVQKCDGVADNASSVLLTIIDFSCLWK